MNIEQKEIVNGLCKEIFHLCFFNNGNIATHLIPNLTQFRKWLRIRQDSRILNWSGTMAPCEKSFFPHVWVHFMHGWYEAWMYPSPMNNF